MALTVRARAAREARRAAMLARFRAAEIDVLPLVAVALAVLLFALLASAP